MTKIPIVDDHPMVREAVGSVVQALSPSASPKFLQPNRRFPRRFNRLRLKRVAWQCLRRDCCGEIEGLPLLWVSLGG